MKCKPNFTTYVSVFFCHSKHTHIISLATIMANTSANDGFDYLACYGDVNLPQIDCSDIFEDPLASTPTHVLYSNIVENFKQIAQRPETDIVSLYQELFSIKRPHLVKVTPTMVRKAIDNLTPIPWHDLENATLEPSLHCKMMQKETNASVKTPRFSFVEEPNIEPQKTKEEYQAHYGWESQVRTSRGWRQHFTDRYGFTYVYHRSTFKGKIKVFRCQHHWRRKCPSIIHVGGFQYVYGIKNVHTCMK